MTESPSNARPRRVRLIVALGLLGVGLGVVGWLRTRGPEEPPALAGPPADPGPGPVPVEPWLAFAGEFRNVRPEVEYVGDAVCGRCHAAVAKTYHQHPMGRSAEWVRPGAAVDHAAGPHGSFDVSGYRLGVVRKDDRVWHHTGLTDGGAAAPPYTVPADLAIGSGSRGRSYLTFDRGAAWQSPVSWFGQRGRWDVSPGFDLGKEVRRPVVPRCLGCHTDQPDPVPDALNRYREPLLARQTSIGCERCHGPGDLHVREREAGGQPARDTAIVNPARLPADLKADVCRQCHLQGAVQVARRGRDAGEYRPGLPWEQFVSTFLRPPDPADALKSVGQFEQMEASRCFTGGGGKMGCTSCHDPHAKPAPAAAAAHFRARCLSCHETHGCSLPVPKRAEKEDRCVDCHMPRGDSSNIAHVAVTDHRIPRHPDPGGPRAKGLAPGRTPLVAYRPGPHAPDPADRDRDLGIALGDECARGGASPDLWWVIERKLDRALAAWPADGAAWLARSRVHAARGDGVRAVAAARAAVGLNPESEVGLIQLAGAAVAADDYETAAAAATRLIGLNPSSADHRLTRATAYFALKDWARAEADCRAALGIQPMLPKARFMLAVCVHQRGDAAGGRRELDLAVKLTPGPEMRATLSKWYGQLTR